MTKRRIFALASLAGFVVAATPFVFASCSNIEQSTNPCTVAADCVAPYVCCRKPHLPTLDRTPPYCEMIADCDDRMPFLVEGNPCGRLPDAGVECEEELICCQDSLTCGHEGSCPVQVSAPDAASNTSCNADPDCADGEICCGINFSYRDGFCSTVAQCRTPQGVEF